MAKAIKDDVRGSGRTTRQIEAILNGLPVARRVLFVTAGPIGYTVNLTLKVCAWRGLAARFERSRSRIVFEGVPDVEIVFASDDAASLDHFRGTGRRVEIDHAARPRRDFTEAALAALR